MRDMHPIPSRSPDTSREAEDVQVRLLRQAPVSRRLHLAWSLSATVIGAARRALARAAPEATQEERDIRFLELHHGAELAEAFRQHLQSRRHNSSATGA